MDKPNRAISPNQARRSASLLLGSLQGMCSLSCHRDQAHCTPKLVPNWIPTKKSMLSPR